MKRLLTFLALAAGPALAVFQHAESAQGRIDAALENSSAMSSLLKLKAEEKLQASWSWEIENPLHVVLAMCFYIAVIPFFWWNESRANKERILRRAVEACASQIEVSSGSDGDSYVTMPDDLVSYNLNPRQIYFANGFIEPPAPLSDRFLGVTFTNAVVLYRIVKVYQNAPTEQKDGTFVWEKKWSASPHGKESHATFTMWRILGGSKTIDGPPIYLQNVRLPPWTCNLEPIERIVDLPQLSPQHQSALSRQLGKELRRGYEGKYYTTETKEGEGTWPEIGDVRVAYFKRSGASIVSVMGSLAPSSKGKMTLQPYDVHGPSFPPLPITRTHLKLLWVASGKKSSMEMCQAHLARAVATNNPPQYVWLLRVFLTGAVLGWSNVIASGVLAVENASLMGRKLADVHKFLCALILTIGIMGTIFAPTRLPFYPLASTIAFCASIGLVVALFTLRI